jgi:hypothetical protein
MLITSLALVAGGFALGTCHGIRKGKQTRARSDLHAANTGNQETGAEGNQGPVAAEDQGQLFSPPVNPLVANTNPLVEAEGAGAGAGAGAAREGAGAGAGRQLDPMASSTRQAML